jgi:hypothetical protein
MYRMHEKGTQMSKSSRTVRPPLHCIGVAGPARLRTSPGTGAHFYTRLRSFILAAFTVALYLVCLAMGTASAMVAHNYVRQITEVPATGPHGEKVTAPSKFYFFTGSAVVSGGLLVSDERSRVSRLDRFSVSTGAFESQIADSDEGPGELAIGNGVAEGDVGSEPAVYLGSGDVLGVYHPSGGLLTEWTGADTPAGAFGKVEGVATDESGLDWASGDVYVASGRRNTNDQAEQNAVFVYAHQPGLGESSPVAELLGTCSSPGMSCPGGEVPFTGVQGVAVDQANGDVLVADEHAVDVFEPVSGMTGVYSYLYSITGPDKGSSFELSVGGVAVDGTDGDIYVWEAEGNPKIVYEFSVEGEHALLGHLTGTPSAGPFSDVSTVAVDPNSHDVFVGDVNSKRGAGVVDVFGGNVVIPDVAVGVPSSLTPTSATLNGTVNPDDAGEVSCEFEYGTSTSYGQRAKCAPEHVANGATTVAVHSGSVTGLRSGTTYYYRLDATNGSGTNTGQGPEDVGEFTTPGPQIVEESVSDIASSSATLGAGIDPHGTDTSYYFQYGPSTEYGTDVPAVPGEAIGSGSAEVPVEQHVQTGLQPGTLYHYRVVTVSQFAGKTEELEGADQTFITQTAGWSSLPDSRQWELVSPPNKHGALLEPIGEQWVIQAAASGQAISYVANVPTEAEPSGYSNLVQVLSTRGPGGWQSRDLTVPHSGPTSDSVGEGEEHRFFSEDLSLSVVQPFGGFAPLSSEASEQTPYLQTSYLSGNVDEPCLPTTMSCYRPLVTGEPGYANVPPGTVFGGSMFPAALEEPCPPAIYCGPHFISATPDAGHVVVSSLVALTKTEAPRGGLYEWSADRPASEQLSLVTLLPPEEGGRAVDGSTLGAGADNENARNAISSDGSRVFWSSLNQPEDHLYMSEPVTERTLRLDTPEPECLAKHECGEGTAKVRFQIASSDGSRVFFTDTGRLTSDSGSGSGPGPDLYECTMVEGPGGPKCDLSDLTPLSPGGESAGVQGAVIGIGEEGCDVGSGGECNVYFVADGVLAPGATPGNCSAAGGICNLYVRHNGTTRFIATLSGQDNLSSGDSPDWSDGDLVDMTARVSPNGQWLAFMSDRELTGYDTHDAVSGKQDEEVYLYNVLTGRTSCASCDPTGARPIGVIRGGGVGGSGEGEGPRDMQLVGGDGNWGPRSWFAANVPGWTPFELGSSRYQSRYLSDEGRLFFNAIDPLVPQAVNGTWDVYEYEPEGVGPGGARCGPAAASGSDVFKAARVYEVEGERGEESAGCTALISSGGSAHESAFLDASDTGGDVFFLTTSKLAPQDYDNAYDVYDAHECTSSSPCPMPVAQSPECTTADACRAAPTPEPSIFGAPPSATFSGIGNLTPNPSSSAAKPKAKPLRCRKDFEKKRGKCVRKPKSRKAGRASDDRRAR